MEIKTVITSQDLAAFQSYQLLRTPGARRRRYLWLFLPPLIWICLWACVLLIFDLSPKNMPVSFWLLLLAVPIYFFSFYGLTGRRVKAEAKKFLEDTQNQSVLGEHRITVDPDGISDTGASGNILRNWQEIMQVVADGDHTYVYVTPQHAIIIPQRCFADQSAYEAFVKAAVIYHWDKENAASQPSSESERIEQKD